MLDINKTRSDFPILAKKVNGQPLIYFDNAATSQKPQSVIEAISRYYLSSNANVHRGIHALSEEATEEYEQARKKIARFINAKSEKEIIFVRNTTEALNLVAYAWGRVNINAGDEIVTTIMEHHSNFLPWRQLAIENQAKLKVVDIGEEGKLLDVREAITKKTKVLALTHASNVLGTINAVPKDCRCLMVVDGAQAVPHLPVNVKELGCDFYAFSAHKMFGPMGAGVLWGREEVLSQLPPFLFGGGMIKNVTLNDVEFADLPDKFEAGTPSVADVIGLGAAIDYLGEIGYGEIAEQEKALCEKFIDGMRKIPEVAVFGPKTPADRVSTFSFAIKNIHPHDAAQFLNDKYAIAVRAGQHCAGPLHERLGVPATVRASLAFYNTEQEVEVFLEAVKDLIKTLG